MQFCMEAVHTVSVGDTIRLALAMRNMSKTELARRTGVSQSTISRVVSGETASPGAYVLRRITEVLNLPASALLGRPSEIRADVGPDLARVPLVRVPAHAGNDWTWQDSGARITTDRTATRGRDLLAVEIAGTCMDPDLSPGDIVIFDQWARTPQDREMVVVTIDDQSQVRWVRYAGRELSLVDNTGSRMSIDGAILEGVVVEIRRQRPRRRDWHDLD